MNFNPDPTPQEIAIWGNLAYIDEPSHKAVLASPFGEFAKAKKEALKFVMRSRIRHAFIASNFNLKEAAQRLGVNPSTFSKQAEANQINLEGLRCSRG